AIAAIGALPVVDAPGADSPLGLTYPELAAGRGVERGNTRVSALHVHYAVDDDRVELRRRAITGHILPGDLKLPDVVLVDLFQRRILRALGPAEILIPPDVIERLARQGGGALRRPDLRAGRSERRQRRAGSDPHDPART